MAAAASSPTLPLAGASWIQSARWDLFWMFAGLWGAGLILLATGAPALAGGLLGLLVLERAVATTHAWSTTWMVLGSDLLAEERRDDPWKYRWKPLGIAAFALALGVTVGTTQRFPTDGRLGPELWAWALYIALFWVGHFWHFGNQDFGVLTLYRARAGQDAPRDRRVDKLYTALMMFVVQPVLFVALLGSTAFGELVRSLLPLPAALLPIASDAAVSVAVLATLAMVVFESAKPKRSVPKLLYVGVIFLHPALLYSALRSGSETLGLLYVVTYLWSHWFIAVGLVSRINTRHYRSRGETGGFAALRHVAVVGGIAGVVILATAPYTDYVLFNTPQFAYKSVLDAIAPARAWIIGLAMGFFLAEQLVHYYCDRCLFRFRDPRVRRKVAPLVLGGPPTTSG